MMARASACRKSLPNGRLFRIDNGARRGGGGGHKEPGITGISATESGQGGVFQQTNCMRSWSHCTVIKERTYTTSPLWPTRWHNTWMNGWCCIPRRKRRDCVRARSSIWVGSGRSICLQRVRADGQSALVLAVYAQAWDSAGQYPNRGFLLHSENRVSLPP